MKITTLPSFFGQEVTIWDGSKIKFDHTGSCEVSKELGKELVEHYNSFMFSGDRKEKVESTKELEISKELVNNLNSEIYSLNEQVKELKDSKAVVEADLVEWQSMIGDLKSRAEAAEELAINLKESNNTQLEQLELKITLMESSKVQLEKLCEDSQYDKKEWELLTKEKLIVYILSK